MIKFESLQILFKEQSLFQSMFAIKSKIRIIINQNDAYQTQDQTLNGKYVRWNTNHLQPIQIPPQQLHKPIEIQFNFFKKDILVGWARTFVTFGKTRSDCLDIIDEKYMVIGKFMFNLQSLSLKQYGSRPQYLSRERSYQPVQGYISRQFYRNPQSKQKPKNHSGENNIKKSRKKFISLICCESARARRRATKPIKLLNIPILYVDQQLEYAPLGDTESWPIQYYSPPFKTIN